MTIDTESVRDGLARGEFFLEYLPTIALADGRCIGAEALIRWRRGGVVVEPMAFIPIAENTPLSGLISYWVIDTVAAELRDWLKAHPDARVAINIPPEIIGRGGIAYAATRSGLVDVAPQVVFELTERGLPDAIGIEAIKSGIRQRGVRVALDDVTLDGAANVALLARGSFDVVKLDRHLIAQIDAEHPHPPWLDELAALARLPRLEIVAEGVETAQQLQALRSAGVRSAQGFYFSRPLAAADFFAFHRRFADGAADPGAPAGA